jgi:hypothetical protein
MKYAFFNTDGRVVTAHNDDTVTNLPDGAVELSDDQWKKRFEFRLQGGTLTYDPLSIPSSKIKALKWDAIKAKRDAIRTGGVKVGTKWFHTDDASRIQFIALNLMGASIPADLQWKTMDSSFVSMTLALAGQVFQAVATLDMQVFAKAEVHKVSMEASENPSEYDFSTGWPQSYADFVAAQVQ